MNTKQTLWMGALAAVGASACCVAPLVLVTLGIGGAWVAGLGRLEPMRPVFVLATLVLLAMAWRKLYRPPTACEPGKPCAGPATQRRQRLVFWLVSPTLLLLLAFPSLAPLFY
jgi:mercuric ion transport protein